MIENHIRIYLLSCQPVFQLLGSDVPGTPARLYPQDRQQGGVYPAVTYQRVSTDHLEGLEAATGYATATIEFDCMATSYGGAKTLAEVLRKCLDGFRGTMGNQKITSCRIQDESDDYDPPADGSAKGVYHVIVSYDFQFPETVPVFS